MIINVAQFINLEQFSRTERQLRGAVFGSRNDCSWPGAASSIEPLLLDPLRAAENGSYWES
jgi:hypothetical protein